MSKIIIGTTKLKSIDFGDHIGFYVTEIKDLQQAFNIRLHLNRIMVDKGIIGHVIINNDDEYSITSSIDIFVYGIKNQDDFEYCKEKFEWIK